LISVKNFLTLKDETRTDCATGNNAKMPPEQVPIHELTTIPKRPEYETPKHDSLFENAAWVYAFCREHLFRDDTNRIIKALWAEGQPAPGTSLIELGCGPGFYACRLGERFRELSITGVDRSARQVQWASERANALKLTNCCFKRINALKLSCPDAAFDVVLASRLFTILPEQAGVMAEMYRVLKPGGRCFVAEPRYALWASVPLFAMWLLVGFVHSRNGYREPHKARVFSAAAFANLFPTQPWKKIKTWQDGRYQYALCKKP
jgi:ubiquinone/menaquinone biosynthesis C-methylase UbiE